MRSVSSVRAVSMMIGRLRVVGFERRRRHTSMPASLGSIQSSTTMSGWRSSIMQQRFLAIGGDRDFVAFLLEIVADQFDQRRLVLDDQRVGLRRRGRAHGGRSSLSCC